MVFLWLKLHSLVDNEEFCDSSQADDVDLNTSKDQTNIIEQKLAALWLKLENIFHVPSAAIDEVLEELSASLCSTTNVIQDTLSSYSLHVDQSVIQELASTLCTSGPVYKSVGKGFPLATLFKCKKYYRDNFKVV